MQVTSPAGNVVHTQKGTSGYKFQLKAPRSGMYKFCFHNPYSTPETVSFYIHVGHIPNEHDLAKDGLSNSYVIILSSAHLMYNINFFIVLWTATTKLLHLMKFQLFDSCSPKVMFEADIRKDLFVTLYFNLYIVVCCRTFGPY